MLLKAYEFPVKSVGCCYFASNTGADQEFSRGWNGCTINGAYSPKLFQFENRSLSKNCFILLYRSPESLTMVEKFRAMFSKEFYQNISVAVVCDEVHTAVH